MQHFRSTRRHFTPPGSLVDTSGPRSASGCLHLQTSCGPGTASVISSGPTSTSVCLVRRARRPISGCGSSPRANTSAANGAGSPVPSAGAASGVCTPPGSPTRSGAAGVTICSTRASSRGAMTPLTTPTRSCGWTGWGGDWHVVVVGRACRPRAWPLRGSSRNRWRRDPAREVLPRCRGWGPPDQTRPPASTPGRADIRHQRSTCPNPCPGPRRPPGGQRRPEAVARGGATPFVATVEGASGVAARART